MQLQLQSAVLSCRQQIFGYLFHTVLLSWFAEGGADSYTVMAMISGQLLLSSEYSFFIDIHQAFGLDSENLLTFKKCTYIHTCHRQTAVSCKCAVIKCLLMDSMVREHGQKRKKQRLTAGPFNRRQCVVTLSGSGLSLLAWVWVLRSSGHWNLLWANVQSVLIFTDHLFLS